MSEPQQQINVGQVANDGTGESLRDAFNAVNNNFANVWAAGPVDSQVVITNNRISTNETNLDLVLAGNGVGNVTVASTTVPSIDAVYDLGRANRRFDEVHAVYYYGNGAYLTGITGNGGGGPNVYFSQGAPDDASIGDIWIESDTGVQYLYFNDNTSNQWAEMEAYQSFSSGGNGTANTGNWGFDGNNLYNLNGGNIINGDLTHGYTAGITIPTNGDTNAILLNNTYGNIILQAGANSDPTATWIFGNNGVITADGNLKLAPDSTNAGSYLDIFLTSGPDLHLVASAGANLILGKDNSANVMTSWNGNAYVQSWNLDTGNVGGIWTFSGDGSTIFPTLTVQRGDNPSGTITGQTLSFGDPSQEAIISTADGTASNEYSQRLVINPGQGYDSGEGGDIYLWAGRGGNNNGSGGDVKIRGGYAPADGTGGYIRIDGGASQANGAPGFIEITGGEGGAYGGYVQITGGVGGNGTGGAVDIIGGYGIGGPGAAVSITGGGSANGLAEYGNVNIGSGASTWSFRNNGTTTFPTGNITSDTSLQLTTTFGNYRTVEYQTAGVWDVYVEDVATGPNDAWSWIDVTFKDNLINKPQVFIENQKASDGIALRWTFDENGNLTLPSNIASINYANGNPYGGSGGANTGNVTFSDQIVIGTGISNLVSGLYLSPSSSSANALQYLRVRGDVSYEPTHIHFDTGNNQYFNQFIGDDNKYVLLSNTGNIVIRTDDTAGNSAQWTFGADGYLTFPRDAAGNTDPYLQIQGGPTPTIRSDDVSLAGPANLAISSDYAKFSGFSGTEFFIYADDGELGGNGNVVLSTNNSNVGNTYNWTFGSDGNLTIPGNIFGSGNILIAPDSASASSYLDIYLTGGPDIHIASNDNSIVIGRDTGANVFVGNDGEVSIRTDNGATPQVWNFDNTGNLILPGNTFAVNYANGTQVSLGGGGNTGNVTFNDQVVVGTGTQDGSGGLYLAPGTESVGNLQYWRVRGGDVATHMHLDTGNNAYFDQYFGDDNKYVLLSNTGNIVINTDNYVGNSAQWTFGTDGTLTLPAGSSRITSYGQITIETDNNASGMYLNADGVNLLYANANVTLRANSTGTNKDWNFGNTGNTAFPNGATFTGYDFYAAANSYIELAGSNDNTYVGLDNNSVFVQTDWNNSQKQWTFDSAGNLTLPGNLTLSNGAVLKDTAGDSVSFGQGAGQTTQGEQAVAIGLQAGFTSQGNYAVAIGKFSANSSQGSYAVAVGPNAGYENQLANAVAIGSSAGASSQGINSVAVGVSAAYNTQGNNAVAVGNSAAYLLQGAESVAIGVNAGIYYLGNNAIAIGANAGNNLQGNNSIVFNATGSNLRNTTANTFTVAPVRNDVANIGQVVFYNTSSKEITYGNTISVAGNVSGNYFIGNGSQLSSVATQVTGSWTLAAGTNTVSLSVPGPGTYSIWVNGNIPNGIVTYTATVVVTNTNVPVVGTSYGWYYAAGNALVLTAIPTQIVGSPNSISTAVVATTTANVFTFGITNNSGSSQVVDYGYTKL